LPVNVAIDRIDRGITHIMESIAPNPRRPFEPAVWAAGGSE
jgi:hypothetical protein